MNAGGISEAANQVWLSRLTGLLMKEGTKTRSAQQLANEAADTGRTNRDRGRRRILPPSPELRFTITRPNLSLWLRMCSKTHCCRLLRSLD